MNKKPRDPNTICLRILEKSGFEPHTRVYHLYEEELLQLMRRAFSAGRDLDIMTTKHSEWVVAATGGAGVSGAAIVAVGRIEGDV